MTRQRLKNLVDASGGFMCGFFFMSFACLRGHLSDAAFVGSLSALALCFGFSLIQVYLNARSAERKFSLSIAALLPLSAFLFYALLMAGSSYNPQPKPIWMIATLALSLGVIATRAGLAVAPALCPTIDRNLLRR
jgi:hypothetical protein